MFSLLRAHLRAPARRRSVSTKPIEASVNHRFDLPSDAKTVLTGGPTSAFSRSTSPLLYKLPPSIKRFCRPQLNFCKIDCAISDFKPVGSYSWTNAPEPTIIVPGSPPIYQDKIVPFTLQPDTGGMFVSQNAARMPDYPLLPIIATITHMQATGQLSVIDLSLKDVDLVSDRRCLRDLTSWATGWHKLGEREDFRIDVHIVGNTIFFVRRVARVTAQCGWNTFGKGFESAMTMPSEDGQSGHHRISQYSFGGMRLLVRCEVDACLPVPSSTPALGRSDQFSSSDAKSRIPAGNGLFIINGGALVEQSLTMELKTKQRGRPFPWAESHVQMVLAQIENHAVGWHRHGQFDTVQRSNLDLVSRRINNRAITARLQGLVIALGDIRAAVKEHRECGPMSLVCRNGVLKLHPRAEGARPVLPQDMLAHFNADAAE